MSRPVELLGLSIAVAAYDLRLRLPEVKPKEAAGVAIKVMKSAMAFDGIELHDDDQFLRAVLKHLQKLENGSARAREATRKAVIMLARKELLDEFVEEAIRLLKK